MTSMTRTSAAKARRACLETAPRRRMRIAPANAGRRQRSRRRPRDARPSATFTGPSNVAAPSRRSAAPSRLRSAKPKALTRAQKLAKALKRLPQAQDASTSALACERPGPQALRPQARSARSHAKKSPPRSSDAAREGVSASDEASPPTSLRARSASPLAPGCSHCARRSCCAAPGACAAGAWWQLSARAAPTNLAPG